MKFLIGILMVIIPLIAGIIWSFFYFEIGFWFLMIIIGLIVWIEIAKKLVKSDGI